MEELKLIMQVVHTTADAGLTAFIWWLIMDKFIWWALWLVAIGGIVFLVRHWIDVVDTASDNATKQDGWLRTLRDVVHPNYAGSVVRSSEFEDMIRIMQRGISVRD